MEPDSETAPETKKRVVGDGTPGPGRPKGIVDRRQRAGIEFARAALARHPDLVDGFLTSKDERIRLDCFKFLYEYEHGKPIQRVEFEARRIAERLAAELGVTADFLLSTAEQIAELTN